MSEPTVIPLEEIQIGQYAETVNVVTEDTIRQFAEVSGDYNPVHMDENFARKTPFRGRIAHGALIASFISGVLGNHLPGPGAIFLTMTLDFKLPTRIGDTVVSRATVKSIDLNTRILVMDCTCMVDGKLTLQSTAEVMVRKIRNKKTS